MCGVTIEKMGFYKINLSYVKYLYNHDSEVYYKPTDDYEGKPYLGIIVNMNSFKYFIPLTSKKNKHSTWDNVSHEHYLIYEIIKKDRLRPGNVFKNYNTTKVIRILSVLDIKKMIPVPEGLYEKMDFKKISNIQYKILLEKEYQFCKPKLGGIIKKAEILHTEQLVTGVVHRYYCNFKLLEECCKNYKDV